MSANIAINLDSDYKIINKILLSFFHANNRSSIVCKLQINLFIKFFANSIVNPKINITFAV